MRPASFRDAGSVVRPAGKGPPITTPTDAPSARPAPLRRAQQYLKQIVYGGNDGIVTTFAIVAGFAGAGAEGAGQIGTLAVLVFGLANLFADGVSMGLGEFLSLRSHRDLHAHTRAAELAALRADPAAGHAGLAAVLRGRGLAPEQADELAGRLMQSPEFAADLRMAYDYRMADPESASPARDGIWTFLAFILFGAIPLLPYLLPVAVEQRLVASVAATACALLALGLLRWSATRERLLRCVAETMLVGGACALVAFAVGAVVVAL